MSTFTRGEKFFELSNHLGNVLATVSDKKIQYSVDGTTVDYYNADVISAQDYYPFGMLMPGRKYSVANTNYRYGFNGKENDNEVKGEGNQQDYGMRIYDSRLGRFLSVDPLTKNFPFYSPYHFAGNNPIANVDLDGGEPLDFKDRWKYHNIFNPKTGSSNGNTITVDDPKLRYVSVEGVYDNWTKQTWFIHQDNQGNYYYLKNLNGDNQTLQYASDPSHQLIGGQFEKFETQDAIQARLSSQLVEGIAIFFAGGITAIAAVPSLPYLSGMVINGSGFSGAAAKTEMGRRLGAGAADATVQGLQIGIGRQEKFNYGSTIGSLLTSNPFGSAVWTTAGEAANGGIGNSSDLLLNFTLNAGGNVLGDKISRGLIVNSAYSKAKDPVTNAIYSYFGNVSGAAGGLAGSTYYDINSSTNNINKLEP